ncbi:hypothetical protein G6F63_016249 [Rhizopus arrhizus]|nr:hypothetical protein G6F63_016249 [Rhizopus arrhizus]
MAMAGAVVFFQQFGAEDVAGHQVGRELHAPELQFQCLPQRAHQQGLAEPGRAFQQAVAAGQQADQQLFDHAVLADHGTGQGAAQRIQARQQGIEVGGGHGRAGPVSCSARTSRC